MSDLKLEERLLRIKEAAIMLAVSVRTVYRLIAAHELAVVHVRGCARVEYADVLAYLERQRRGGA